MSDTATATLERLCRIEDVFDPAFLELVRLVPRNPHVRALILKFTGKLPPPECGSFEQVRDWVETNCRPQPKSQRSGRGARDNGIAINVEFSETEYGRASYSVRCAGSADFRVGAEELLEMVESAIDSGGGMDAVVEAVAEKIEEDGWNQCEPDTEACGDYDYNDHDVTSTDDSDIEYSKNDIRAAVLAFVRERRPELVVEL